MREDIQTMKHNYLKEAFKRTGRRLLIGAPAYIILFICLIIRNSGDLHSLKYEGLILLGILAIVVICCFVISYLIVKREK